VRCYFMKDGHIAAVAFLVETTDAGRIVEAKRLFVADGLKHKADGFEVWDGPRFVYRFPEEPPTT
jgi:hypothetical protein